jgi:AraC family transcriptional regulator
MALEDTIDVDVERAVGTSRVAVELRTYDFSGPYEGVHREDRCFIDFSLSRRAGVARGRYEGVWQPSRYESIGDILFVPAGMSMLGSCGAGRQQSLSCYFDSALFSFRSGRLDDGSLAETLHIESPLVRNGLFRILRETSQPSLATPLAIEAAAMLLAVDVVRHLDGRGEGRVKKGGLSPTQMKLVEDRIRATAPLPTISELAVACGVSERHLARAFQQETSRALGDYINAAGVDRAWRLLTDSDLSIRQIAGALGFAGSSSFSFAFRRATGRRPRDVRQSAQRIPRRA